ncbi:MAG: hypothetical protein FK733_17630 [Asgard group archaeon]|nr:hypothetical protein [Asgard group archaeon]
MKYEIKQYQEEFLEEIYEVGVEALKDWTYEAQTPVVSLKQSYSRPEFDPETRLYAFSEGKMIGFVVSRVLGEVDSKIKADISYPRVLKDYNDAFDLLFEKVVEVLKTKDVKVVRTTASEKWPNTIGTLEKLGYSYVSDRYHLYNLKTKNYNIDKTIALEDITVYDHKKDKKDVVNFLVKSRGMDEDRANSYLDSIVNIYSEEIFIHIIARKDNQIISRLMCTRIFDDTANFYLSGEDDSLDKEILAKTITILKEKGIKNLNLFLTEDNLNQEERHLNLGFKKEGKVSLYEKEI